MGLILTERFRLLLKSKAKRSNVSLCGMKQYLHSQRETKVRWDQDATPYWGGGGEKYRPVISSSSSWILVRRCAFNVFFGRKENKRERERERVSKWSPTIVGYKRWTLLKYDSNLGSSDALSSLWAIFNRVVFGIKKNMEPKGKVAVDVTKRTLCSTTFAELKPSSFSKNAWSQ